VPTLTSAGGVINGAVVSTTVTVRTTLAVAPEDCRSRSTLPCNQPGTLAITVLLLICGMSAPSSTSVAVAPVSE
jgi:hypothetical protein